jgi:hypothetical protein
LTALYKEGMCMKEIKRCQTRRPAIRVKTTIQAGGGLLLPPGSKKNP